jgi:hypothetical protein
MKQAAKLDKQRVDLENQYRKEISDSQRSQIIDAMWQSYMSPE